MRHLIAAALVISALGCRAAPDKVAYELQERCGKQASAEFRREFGAAGVPVTQSGKTTLHNFQNHYNSKLNACIYLLRSSGFNAVRGKKPGESTGAYEMQALFDLNENREIASYFKFADSKAYMDCRVGGKACQSKEEWESLIRPYLED